MANEITLRDEKGRVVPGGKVLSPETASAMGRKRWSDEKSENVKSLLIEAGFVVPDEAPSHLRLLAERAVSGGVNSVGAIKEFIRQTRGNNPGPAENNPLKPPPGQLCPVCGRMVEYTFEDLELAKDAFDQARHYFLTRLLNLMRGGETLEEAECKAFEEALESSEKYRTR